MAIEMKTSNDYVTVKVVLSFTQIHLEHFPIRNLNPSWRTVEMCEQENTCLALIHFLFCLLQMDSQPVPHFSSLLGKESLV